MLIKLLFRKCWHFIRLFFHFKRPALIHFEVLDIVLDKKPLVIISWNCRYPYMLQLKAAKWRTYKREGMYILSLPKGIELLKFELHSGWSKTAFKFVLQSVPVSQEIMDSLIPDAKRIQYPAVAEFNFKSSVPLQTILKTPAIHLPAMGPAPFQVSIDPFIYHQP